MVCLVGMKTKGTHFVWIEKAKCPLVRNAGFPARVTNNMKSICLV